MRKIDKLLNIQKANILNEQRYIESKETINELSPEYRRNAANVAKNKYSDIDNQLDRDEIKFTPEIKAKRYKLDRQIQKFNNSIHPSVEKEAQNVATSLNPNARVAVLEMYNGKSEPYTRLLFVDGSNHFELKITKDEFSVIKNDFHVSFYPEPPIELTNLIKNLQAELR